MILALKEANNERTDKDTLLPESRVRKRKRDQASDAKVPSGSMESSPEKGGGRGSGISTLSSDLAYRNGEWQKRSIMETTVIVTEPRAANKLERDDGDSGISEAAEEHLLPRGSGARGREGGAPAPEYANGKKETILETLIQIFIPFMIAGFGMMAAGLLLDTVQVCLYSTLPAVSVPYHPSLPALGGVH